MKKLELVRHLAQHAGITHRESSEILNGLRDLAAEELSAGRDFMLPGIGKLSVVERKARRGRNVQTGEPIEIPARRVVRCRISRPFQDDCCT